MVCTHNYQFIPTIRIINLSLPSQGLVTTWTTYTCKKKLNSQYDIVILLGVGLITKLGVFILELLLSNYPS